VDAVLQPEIAKQIDRLCKELLKRQAEHDRLLPYRKRTDQIAIPSQIATAKLTKRYLALMKMSQATWGKPIVAAKLDRLEVNGLTSPDKAVSLAVWDGVWQENNLNLMTRLANSDAMADGRAHATVWPASQWLLDGDGGVAGADGPGVTFDGSTTMIVEYAEGSLTRRTGALRRWTDDDDEDLLLLYRPDGLYKFRATKDHDRSSASFEASGRRWVPREEPGEAWPLPNPLGIVPVIELGVNRELASGRFAMCRGEYADVTPRLDAVNLLTFLGLDLAVSMSYPLRILFGDVAGAEARKDDSGNPLPPFDAYIGGVSHITDKDARIDEFKAADRAGLSIYGELQQVAALTATPKHYFPNDGVIANVSAETITAFEGPMHATVTASHQPSLGAAYEEILRIGALMLPVPVKLSPRAEVTWADHQSRSLGEQASAYAQLTGGENGMPMAAAAEIALGASQDAIRRYEEMHADSAFAQITQAVRDLTKPPDDVPLAA
jgi:hypothetical protein